MTFDEYVAEFSGNAAWGGTLDLAAMALELDLRIWIVTSEGKLLRYNGAARSFRLLLSPLLKPSLSYGPMDFLF